MRSTILSRVDSSAMDPPPSKTSGGIDDAGTTGYDAMAGRQHRFVDSPKVMFELSPIHSSSLLLSLSLSSARAKCVDEFKMNGFISLFNCEVCCWLPTRFTTECALVGGGGCGVALLILRQLNPSKPGSSRFSLNQMWAGAANGALVWP